MLQVRSLISPTSVSLLKKHYCPPLFFPLWNGQADPIVFFILKAKNGIRWYLRPMAEICLLSCDQPTHNFHQRSLKVPLFMTLFVLLLYKNSMTPWLCWAMFLWGNLGLFPGHCHSHLAPKKTVLFSLRPELWFFAGTLVIPLILVCSFCVL